MMLLIEPPRLINIASLSAHLFPAGWLRVQIVPCRVHQHVHCKVVAIFCEKLSKCLSWHFQLKAALIYLSKTVVALWQSPMLSELRLHHGLSTPFKPTAFPSPPDYPQTHGKNEKFLRSLKPKPLQSRSKRSETSPCGRKSIYTVYSASLCL